MVRRGPASVFARKSSSKPFLEDRPDRFRPPPCMPDGDPTVRSASGMMVLDHSVRASFGRCSSSLTAGRFVHGAATRRAGAGGWPSLANLFRCSRYGRVLCRRIRRDAGDGPDEPCQLAPNRGDHVLVQFAPRHHVTIALTKPGLR